MTAQQLIAFPGTSAFRSIGGTAGTQEVQIYHNGTNGTVLSKLGNLSLQPATGGNLVLNLHNWPTTDGSAGYSIVTNGSGQLSFANVGTGSLTSIVAGTGLTGGTITNSGTIAIGTSGVTAGTYAFPTVVVNALGQVTSATAGTPVTNIATGTGLTGGAITSTGTISMGTSGVTAGTYGNGSNLPQITVDALGRVTAASNISFSAGGNTRSISQTAHGFSVGNVLGLSGTTFVKALADTSSDAEVVGIVSTVTDANDFVITTGGYINTLSGLTAGSVYFLSATTSGLLTTTAPSTAGQISKPLLIADTGTSGYFYNFRGVTLGTSSTIAGSSLLGNSSGTSASPAAISLGQGITISSAGSLNVSTLGGFVNKIRNGGFDIWQRGTSGSLTSTSAYNADGWIAYAIGANGSWAQAANNRSGAKSLYGIKLIGATGNTNVSIHQRIESYLAVGLAGQTVTFQIWVYNSTGSAFTAGLGAYYPSSQDNWGTSNLDTSVNLQTTSSGTGWTQLSYTWNASTSASNGYDIYLNCNALGSGQYLIFAEADLRVTPGVSTGTNSNPPPAELRPIPAELSFCERYFQTSYDNGVAPGTINANGAFYSRAASSACDNFMFFRTSMRTDPTVVAYSISTGSANKFYTSGGDVTANYATNSQNGVDIYNNSLTAGQQVTIHWSASAEL